MSLIANTLYILKTSKTFLIVGAITLFALIFVVSHFGDIEHFSVLLKQAEPAWLVLVIFFQVFTYFFLGRIWKQFAKARGYRFRTLVLVPSVIKKLTIDQF